MPLFRIKKHQINEKLTKPQRELTQVKYPKSLKPPKYYVQPTTPKTVIEERQAIDPSYRPLPSYAEYTPFWLLTPNPISPFEGPESKLQRGYVLHTYIPPTGQPLVHVHILQLASSGTYPAGAIYFRTKEDSAETRNFLKRVWRWVHELDPDFPRERFIWVCGKGILARGGTRPHPSAISLSLEPTREIRSGVMGGDMDIYPHVEDAGVDTYEKNERNLPHRQAYYHAIEKGALISTQTPHFWERKRFRKDHPSCYTTEGEFKWKGLPL